MNSEPRSNRIHIALFGRCNSGKSTLLNAMAGEEVSIVSQQAGTTTDVVRKNIELPELGACVLLDTAGLDDNSLLAQQRIAQTRKELEKAEIENIVYISCNPATLARDVGLLVGSLVKKDGMIVKAENFVPKYEITYIRPYDFFPHTRHIETLV